MRAFLLPFVFALLAALPAIARAQDANDDLRRYLNGSWTLTFREEVKGGTGDIKSVATIITITLRYDGTRTITQDEYLNDQAPIRSAEVTDYYRVDDIDGTNFTLTSWSDGAAPQTSKRTRTGTDTMQAEGSDAVYQRVAGSQETVSGPLPPQRDLPAPNAQDTRDAAMRAFIVGRWTTSLARNGQTIVSILDYDAGGGLSGTQSVTANGQTQSYSIKGTYTVVATGDQTFTLTLNIPGIAPITSDLQVVDQNTLFNPKENYQARRAP